MMSLPNTKRQRTEGSDEHNEESNLNNALSYFNSNYKGFLQECMKKSGFKKSMIKETNEVFWVVMSEALRIDTRKAKDFNLSCDQSLDSSIMEHLNDKNYQNSIDDSEVISKINRFINIYKKESYTFRKLSMFMAGYHASKVLEKNQSYLTFMLKSINIVYKYLAELEPENKKNNVPHETIEKKAESIIQKFLTSVSENNLSQGELVHKSTHYTIYRAKKGPSYVALKVLNEKSDDSNTHNLENEFHATQFCSHPCLRKSIEKTTYENNPALTLEWFDGMPVEEYGKLALHDFMFVAREIVAAVAALHDQNINHLNITTTNILVNLQKRTVKLIGLTSSTKYETIKYETGNQKRLKNSTFIPPEQTGCINLHVDLRSDLYDIGMIFYFMLIGKLPFCSKNKSQVVHNSLFCPIKPLHEIDPYIPMDLSNMILKLLEKDPVNRYQSAKGILYDLDLLNDQDGDSRAFQLAERDFSTKLLIPQKLYGRSKEIKELNSAFDKACEGLLEVIFIKGLSGTGKSHLAHELLESVTRKNGIFIQGKFEESTMTVPYSGIISALNHFCQLILQEGSETVSIYKEKILSAVGEEGAILTNMVPDLRLTIGEQEKVLEVIELTAKNRFEYVCCRFLRAICTEDRPLVILLDDLHRADEDSYHFLSVLLKDRDLKHVLFIGTYHSDKVDEYHPLANMITVMNRNKTSVTTLELGNLSNEMVNDLIADALSRERIATLPLSALVIGKTAGNPFFVTEFLKSLERKGLLYFSGENLCWKWNIEDYDTKKISDNVLNFITEKVRDYSSSMQNFLVYASFIGSTFSSKTLKLVDDAPVDIDRMIKDGFIMPNGSKDLFRFTHDYVQQALFSMIPSENRDFTYFNIGNLIWKKSSKAEMQDNLFIIAQMLNSSLHQLNFQEKRDVAELNIQAAEKCTRLTAFQPALDFVKIAIGLLSDNCWEVDYEFTFKLYSAAAENCYCLMSYDKMREYLSILAENAKCELDLVPSYLLQMKAYNHQYQYNKAFELGLRVLDDLGEKIPMEIEDHDISKEINENIYQSVHKISNLDVLNVVQDKSIEATFQFLYELFTTTFFYNRKLFPLIGGRVVKLTCDHGLSKYSAIGLAVAGRMFCSIHDFENGYLYGQLAVAIIDKLKAKDLFPKFVAYLLTDIFYYKRPIPQLMSLSLDATVKAFEIGDNESSSYNFSVYFTYSFHSGKSLRDLVHDFESISYKIQQKPNHLKSTYQMVLNLVDYVEDSSSSWLLQGEHFDCRKDIDFVNQPGHAVKGLYQCIIIACIFNKYEKAKEWLQMGEMHEAYLSKTCIVAFFTLYQGLIYAEHARMSKEKYYLEKIQHSIDLLQTLSKACPENYLNKFALLQSELFAINGESNAKDIIESYNKAISLSKKNGFIHEAAIACERAGVFFLQTGYTNARNYFTQAFELYKQWGATAKLIQMKKLYSTYLSDMSCPNEICPVDAKTISTVSHASFMS